MFISDQDWFELKKRLARSPFRSRFKLSPKDKKYYSEKGAEEIRKHAFEFIRDRLASAEPKNDGKQTPWEGHPVFTAQHATAACCRKCIEKWHGIVRGRELTRKEMGFIVDLLARWLEENRN